MPHIEIAGLAVYAYMIEGPDGHPTLKVSLHFDSGEDGVYDDNDQAHVIVYDGDKTVTWDDEMTVTYDVRRAADR